MRADALKGHLDGLLLSALETGPQHGYAIMETLRARSGGEVDLPTGTIYPGLHRLARNKLVRSTWSTVDGRRRRTYELTSAGRKALAAERAGWRQFESIISALLEGVPRPSSA